MESNEQTELTSKIEKDSSIETRMTALGRGLGSGRIEQEGKRTHGRGQECGDCWRRGYKGTKRQCQKNTIKI